MNNYCPKLPYTIEEFRKWLQSLPMPSSTAGYAGLPNCCPAAKWLSNMLGVPAHVDYDQITIDGSRYNAPSWLVDFQDKVDGWPRGTDIGRRQALNLLTRVERVNSL